MARVFKRDTKRPMINQPYNKIHTKPRWAKIVSSEPFESNGFLGFVPASVFAKKNYYKPRRKLGGSLPDLWIAC